MSQRFGCVKSSERGELFAESTWTQYDCLEKLIVVSFGSGNMFPIHGLTIPFSLIVRLTLSLRVV